MLGITYAPNPCKPVLVVPSMSVYEIVSEYTDTPRTSTISNGMIIFDDDSIPLLTPRNIINATIIVNTSIIMIGSAV